jgi:hypothetical protein
LISCGRSSEKSRSHELQLSSFGKLGASVEEQRHFVTFTPEPQRDNSRFVGNPSFTGLGFARHSRAIGGKPAKGVPPAMIVRQTEQPCAS